MSCFICGAPMRLRRLRMDRATIALCEACGHGRTVACEDDADGRVYGADEGSREAYEGMYLSARAPSYRRGLDLLGGPRDGVLVDVGCGYGHFLEIARGENWRARGFEPAAGQREKALASVKTQIFATLEQAIDGVRIAALTLWDSLEHMENPGGELERLGAIVEDGGLLLVRAPDARVFRALDRDWRLRLVAPLYLKLAHPTNPEEHPHHFTPESLGLLARAAGFEPLRWIDAPPDERVISSRMAADAVVRRILHRIGQGLPYEFTMLMRKQTD